MGYDGFEDYNFNGCDENEHFGFRKEVSESDAEVSPAKSHTGRFSLKVTAGQQAEKIYRVDCEDEQQQP